MNQNKPFFSIILATYNRAYCIERAINSVVNQSFKNWELIIVDDGSSDNTDKIVKKYLSDRRIKYIKLEKNSGVNVARNRGYKEASGKWCFILDSDNFLEDDILNKFLLYINKYNFPYMKFISKNIRTSSNMTEDFKTGFISSDDFLIEKVKGEFHTLIKTDLQKKFLFFEDINGGEGIVWKLIAKYLGKVLLVNEVSILYDDSSNDRLSIKNYKRLCKIFKKDISLLGKDYFKISKLYFFKTFFKRIFYCLNSQS